MKLRDTGIFLIILGLSLMLSGCNAKFLNLEVVGSAPYVNNGVMGPGQGYERPSVTHYSPIESEVTPRSSADNPGSYDCARPGYTYPVGGQQAL